MVGESEPWRRAKRLFGTPSPLKQGADIGHLTLPNSFVVQCVQSFGVALHNARLSPHRLTHPGAAQIQGRPISTLL